MQRHQESRPRSRSGETEENRLLGLVADGDRVAFEQLYRDYYPRLLGYLLHLVGSRERAEEVLNDVMVVVWQKARAFENRSRVSTWIFGIAYRRALKRQSRRRLHPSAQAPLEMLDRHPAKESPERDLDQKELRSRVLATVQQLPIDQRAVVLLTYFEDLPYKEIAVALQCPVNTVKTRMFHARRKLRVALSGVAS